MATNLENLEAARTSLITKLASIAAADKHKASYSIDGQSVSWNEYHAMLTKQIAEINALIQAERPYCVVSRGRS